MYTTRFMTLCFVNTSAYDGRGSTGFGLEGEGVLVNR